MPKSEFWAREGTFVGSAIGVAATAAAAFAPESFSIASLEAARASTMLGAGALATGAAFDITRAIYPTSNFRLWLLGLQALRDKAKEDFRGAILTSWSEIGIALDTVIRRRDIAEARGYRCWHRDHYVSIASLRRYLSKRKLSSIVPLPQSLDTLRAIGPLRINSSRINTGVEMALLIMMEDFGVPLIVNNAFANGIEQINWLNERCDADFVLMADANVVMGANHRMSAAYRYLLPVMWNKQFLLERANTKSYHRRQLYTALKTSGHEQAVELTASIAGYANCEMPNFGIEQLPDRIRDLDHGQATLAWNPLIALNGLDRYALTVRECTDYLLCTSLYCSNRWASKKNSSVRNAFQDCLIAAWNRAFMFRRETTIRLAARHSYRREFRKDALPKS